MANLPENEKTTVEERAEYGRKIEARNASFENKEVLPETRAMADHEIPPPLTEEEVRAKVGDQNYKNVNDDNSSTSINS